MPRSAKSLASEIAVLSAQRAEPKVERGLCDGRTKNMRGQALGEPPFLHSLPSAPIGKSEKKRERDGNSSMPKRALFSALHVKPANGKCGKQKSSAQSICRELLSITDARVRWIGLHAAPAYAQHSMPPPATGIGPPPPKRADRKRARDAAVGGCMMQPAVIGFFMVQRFAVIDGKRAVMTSRRT